MSLIRAYGRTAGFKEIIVRDQTVKLKYDLSAKPDGMQLLAVLSSEANIRLVAGEAATIVWKPAASNVEEIVKKLPQFLYRLMHCIAVENDL